MYNKLIALFAAVIVLLTGCSLKQTNSREQDTVVQEKKQGIANTPRNTQSENTENSAVHTAGVEYSINKEFKQGEVTTTVRDILLYPDTEGSEDYSIVQFNMNVKNNTGRDIYMVFDISPLVLNTGEQVDYASKCDLHRVFKNVVKDGMLVYKVKSKIEDIKTLRWVIASPLYNGTQVIGQECDFTFVLDKYDKGSQNNSKSETATGKYLQ